MSAFIAFNDLASIVSDIQGSKLTSEQATIASEIIELVSLKNSDYESHFGDKSGFITRTIASKGRMPLYKRPFKYPSNL